MQPFINSNSMMPTSQQPLRTMPWGLLYTPGSVSSFSGDTLPPSTPSAGCAAFLPLCWDALEPLQQVEQQVQFCALLGLISRGVWDWDLPPEVRPSWGGGGGGAAPGGPR